MTNSIRLINKNDIESVLDIYIPYIKNTAISFEEHIPTLIDFGKRVKNITNFYPWLVYEENDKIHGYAYACEHRLREAYKWSVDVAVYIDTTEHGKGIGSALYKTLFEILRKQGFYNAYAGIALPNEKSVSLHEKFGFQKIAEYNKVGYKLHKWWNVGWWELELQNKNIAPTAPVSIETVSF